MKDKWHLSYRPDQLDDIVGNESTVQTLKKASELNKFANSYFFTGNKGSGKTSTARILAKLINCKNPNNGIICNECESCKMFGNEMMTDIVELDGANNGKVDDVTELIESSRYNPNYLEKKVFIIDEAHMLTKSAVSALLKITEEPPSYLVFIFCTTDPEKMISTLTSRAQRFNFNKIKSKDILKRLKYIADQENVKIDGEALLSIARNSEGSMRNAIVSLEQISTAYDDINYETVCNYFGNVDYYVYDLVGHILNQNIVDLLKMINDLLMSNVNCKTICYEVSELFRKMLFFKSTQRLDLLDCTEEEELKIKNYSELVDIKNLHKVSKGFSKMEKELAYSINERFVLESTLLLCSDLLKK